MDLRINETLQTGGVRKTKRPFYRLVGTVSNPDRSGSRESGQAYSVRLETLRSDPENRGAPTGPDKSVSKPRGESVYLFLESTIIAFSILNHFILKYKYVYVILNIYIVVISWVK